MPPHTRKTALGYIGLAVPTVARVCSAAKGGLIRGTTAALLAFLVACNTEGNLFAPDRIPGQSGGGGSTRALIGEWETILLIAVEDDLQNWTTRWLFGVNRACRFTQITESLVEGFPRTEVRPCTWTTSNNTLTVRFSDNGEVLPMEFDFAGLDPNRLVLDDIEYHRFP